MRKAIINSRILIFFILASLQSSSGVAGDWPEWRGPSRDGTSKETGLPTKWTPAGEGLVWKQPYGGRSAPVIMGGRVFLFLYTDNFWRDYERYKAQGVVFVREPKDEAYGIVAVFKDLYGNLWDLFQPKSHPTIPPC